MKDGVAVECDNCGWKGDSADLGEYRDVHEDAWQPGEIMPAGECPECQCGAHLVEALERVSAATRRATTGARHESWRLILKLRKAQEALDKVVRHQDPPLDIDDILELPPDCRHLGIDEAMATIDRATGGEFRLNEYLENRSYGGPGGRRLVLHHRRGRDICHGQYATFKGEPICLTASPFTRWRRLPAEREIGHVASTGPAPSSARAASSHHGMD